jgi:hypothetical protein
MTNPTCTLRRDFSVFPAAALAAFGRPIKVKFRSVAKNFENRSGKSWTAVVGLIATQLGDLLSDGYEIFDALSLVVC